MFANIRVFLAQGVVCAWPESSKIIRGGGNDFQNKKGAQKNTGEKHLMVNNGQNRNTITIGTSSFQMVRSVEHNWTYFYFSVDKHFFYMMFGGGFDKTQLDLILN